MKKYSELYPKYIFSWYFTRIWFFKLNEDISLLCKKDHNFKNFTFYSNKITMLLNNFCFSLKK